MSGARRGPQLLRELGPHPAGGTVPIYRGRYGPYVSHDGIIASLPKAADPDTFTLEAAVALLETQRAKGKPRRTAKKAPVRKVASAAGNGATKPARRAATKRAKPKAAAKPARRRPA